MMLFLDAMLIDFGGRAAKVLDLRDTLDANGDVDDAVSLNWSDCDASRDS